MQKRDIAISIVLSIVTCGIYGIYWFIVLTNDVNEITDNKQDTSGGICFLLTLVTCGIYGIYWAYQVGENIERTKNARGIVCSNTGVLYLILALFGFSIITYALAQNEINKLMD